MAAIAEKKILLSVFFLMSQWSLGNISVPSLYACCENEVGFSIPTDDFQANMDALNIFTLHLTRQQRRQIRDTYNPPYVWRKFGEDRIGAFLSVQKDGKVKLNMNCWEHGRRRVMGTFLRERL